jgi:hypothetical protein
VMAGSAGAAASKRRARIAACLEPSLEGPTKPRSIGCPIMEPRRLPLAVFT